MSRKVNENGWLTDTPQDGAIEYAPVRHGQWIEREVIDEIDSSTAIDQWQVARCSVCGKYHTTPYLYYFTDYEYCPWCGSKMDEVEE